MAIFRVDPTTKHSVRWNRITFAEAGIRERYDLQEWISQNPSILGEELLVVAKEFNQFAC